MVVNMVTGQTRRTHWKNKPINVCKLVAESWICCVIDKTPGLMPEKDENNEDVLTYVELQRGRREKAVV